MAISFTALAFHRYRRDEVPRAQSSIVLGLLLAAALLTRSIGITLVAAVAIDEAWRVLRTRDPARAKCLAITLFLPLVAGLAWYAMRPAGGEDLYRYAWTFGAIPDDAAAIYDAWLNALLIYWGEWWRPAFLGASLIGATGLGCAIWRAVQGESDALYCVMFLGLLLFWPFPGQFFRIVFPVVPIVLVHAFFALSHLLRRRWGAAAADRSVPAMAIVLLALCVPPLFYVAGRAGSTDIAGDRKPMSEVAEFYRVPDLRSARASATMQIEAMEDMERIRATTPKDARVMWVMPNYIALLAQRSGVMHNREAQAPPVARQVLDTQADYLYLANVHPHDSHLRFGNPVDDWARVGTSRSPCGSAAMASTCSASCSRWTGPRQRHWSHDSAVLSCKVRNSRHTARLLLLISSRSGDRRGFARLNHVCINLEH